MTTSMLNMIRTNFQWLLASCFIGLLLPVSACNAGTGSQQKSDTVDLNESPLGVALNTAVAGFTDEVAVISGDFDENGLTDKAMVLSSGSEWRLAVMFQQHSGSHDVVEIDTFPGSDDDWYAIPANRLQLFLATGDESPTDRIGLKVMEQTDSLEFFWYEKNRSFIASRIHNETAAQQSDVVISKNQGEATLQAVDPNTSSEGPGDVDLDQQSDVNSSMADLRFTAGGGSMIFYTLVPIGDAMSMAYGKSPPSYDDCLETVASMSADNMPEVEQGMYFCVKIVSGLSALAVSTLVLFNLKYQSPLSAGNGKCIFSGRQNITR